MLPLLSGRSTAGSLVPADGEPIAGWILQPAEFWCGVVISQRQMV